MKVAFIVTKNQTMQIAQKIANRLISHKNSLLSWKCQPSSLYLFSVRWSQKVVQSWTKCELRVRHLLCSSFGIGNYMRSAAETTYSFRQLFTNWNSFRSDFFDEINFMKKLGFHIHLVNMIGCITSTQAPMLVLELCSNGDLLTYLRTQKKQMKEVSTMKLRVKCYFSSGPEAL